ncbi:MAG: hypothetical protein JHC93_08365 [Parachlamydiales bacterium]|nr:hypothetical protein [Parachlamydiales bacterium]
MQTFLRKILISAILFSVSPFLCYTQTPSPDTPSYQFAMVRNISDSFENSLKLNPPLDPINLDLAKQQHEMYIDLIQQMVSAVVRIDADRNHPDCNFIEDTAIIVDDIAVISRMGAIERRGEEGAVAQILQELGKNIVHIHSPGTMDGGDILHTGKHLFVGLSQRTNEYALEQLKSIFQGKTEVVGIPVANSLHLKSVLSFFDSETLIVADTKEAKVIQSNIESLTNEYTFVSVPDVSASNVLRIGSNLIVQDGFSASEATLQDLCNQKSVNLIKIDMSELIKADGALTCGCLLFN